MGLFFDRVPSQGQVDILADAYQHNPADEGNLERLTGQYLRALGGTHLNLVTTALRSDAMAPAQAQDRARAALANMTPPAQTQFKPLRLIVALLIFFALVGAGIGCDAAHLANAPGALFGFAGSVFGVVTAFLGLEKGS